MKQKTIKSVLMCKPLHFSDLNYIINPWMKPGTINNNTAMEQWNNLVTIYTKLGITVKIINQEEHIPDMVFATDQGIVHGKKVLLSSFWYEERRNETKCYKDWFEKNGYELNYLPTGAYFEGNGDACFVQDKLLVGIGFRADEFTCDAVSRALDIEVIPLQITNANFYHLDVGFLLLNDETAFYYPKAFSKQSREVLKKLLPNLIELSDEEAEGFCANSVVSGKNVIHQSGNPTFTDKLTKLGYKSIDVDLSEFKKSGGGAHCLTNILSYNN